jgi:SSS family solute:Na+ symporter
MPEFIKLRFGRASHRFLSFYALLSIIVFWLGTTLFAGAFVLSEILDWSLITSILFLTVTATSFTFLGGLAAIVRTEIFQSVLIIIATTILTVLAFNEVGSIDNLVAKVPTDYWELLRPSDDKNYPWQGFILGYPVLGIWFWCAEQTIVQRVLAAKNIKEAQLGTIFTSFLKVIMPFILFFPGILAYALFPEMADPRNAYLALITNVLPIGLVGLVIAALIATLTGSIASGINSFSTVFTLDIYKNFLNPTADNNKLKRTGQIMTLVAAVLSMVFAYLLSFLEQGLFDLLQGIISFFAPPISAVFLIGVLWKRATPIAAFLTFVLGTITCLTTGYFYLTKQGMFGLFNYEDFPHFLILSFYLFAGLSIFMIIVSLVTKQDKYINFPTLAESYLSGGNTHNRLIWTLWAAVAVMMGALYLIF